MEGSNIATRGMAVTPHHLATQSALSILKEGGTAMEATIAAAATLAVVYPHMNTIGGDGFWLIISPKGEPFVIEACGAAGSLATKDFFKNFDGIPLQGPKSAITVPGAVGGWKEALDFVVECGYQKISVGKLLEDAIYYAENGFPVSKSLAKGLQDVFKHKDLSIDFHQAFSPNSTIPKEGDILKQTTLARTLKMLSQDGLGSFYKGKLADTIADDMKLLGVPITKNDLATYKPLRKVPLQLHHEGGVILNTPPPTQGLVSLTILGILDRLRIKGNHEGEFIHTTVEATKQAFDIRDKYITDPNEMEINAQYLLGGHKISELVLNIDKNRASSKANAKGPGDTVWLGVMDSRGFSVSYIQSVYHTFGSGVILPKTGILLHNRGVCFSLKEDHILTLKPNKKPFHTLNPAAALLSDGRVMIYGTRGGDGQSQTQAAIFHRYVVQGLNLQMSISAPRWLYGESFIKGDNTLKLENRFSGETLDYLKERGHSIKLLESFSEKMGHAGAIVRHVNGSLEGAFDVRSDGSVAGF